MMLERRDTAGLVRCMAAVNQPANLIGIRRLTPPRCGVRYRCPALDAIGV